MARERMRDVSIEFGAVLRRRRAQRGLTQEQLAEKAALHPTAIGLIERGKRNASLDVAARLARALGLKLSVLVAEAERGAR